MRLDFVINPNASRVDPISLTAAIRARFADRQVTISDDVSKIPPTNGDLRVIVAVGGDGTVSRVLNGMAGEAQYFGVLPFGTANDFARALGIPDDFEGACAVLEESNFERVDTIRVNGWRVATCGGIGFAVDVAVQANRWKSSRFGSLVRALGALVYPLATLRRLISGSRAIRADVSGSGFNGRFTISTAMISNQPRFGGRFSTSPQADNRDGELDLCLIDQTSGPIGLSRIAARIYQGQPGRCSETRQFRARDLIMHTDRIVPFFADGEVLGSSDRFDIKTEAGRLQVAVGSV